MESGDVEVVFIPFGAAQGKNGGCAQCAHPELRIGSYWDRFGSDWGSFRGIPVFARAGVRFESHIGHSMSPRQRGFLL